MEKKHLKIKDTKRKKIKKGIFYLVFRRYVYVPNAIATKR